MNKANYASKIKLNSFDDLFGMNDPVKGAATEIKEIPIAELHDFEGHPFRVVDDERMDELVQSVKENGVLVPGIARVRKQGGYEIVSGHRRKRACELAGLDKIPMFIKTLSDEDAVVAMVDSNIQRENILPSEKARAYQMRYNAIKNQGTKGNSLKQLMESTGESEKKIQRYIWLARLSDELLQMVDDKKLPLVHGVNLSFLLVKEQKWVLDYLKNNKANISAKQTEQLKLKSQQHELTEEEVKNILLNDRPKNKKNIIQFEDCEFSDFFDESYQKDDIKRVIIELLTEWKSNQKED